MWVTETPQGFASPIPGVPRLTVLQHGAREEVAVTVLLWLGMKCCHLLQDGDWCTAHGSAGASPGHQTGSAGS